MPPLNAELTARARAKLDGKWTDAAIVTLVYFVLMAVAGAIPLANLVVGGPLFLGYSLAILDTVRGERPLPRRMFEGFNAFINAFVASLLVSIFTLLWMLLLIVPGLMAMLSYSQTFFILADEPRLEGLEAIRRSKAMMAGQRWRLAGLWLRFTGWFLLGICTAGIGFIWILPYFAAAQAEFYEDLKKAPPAA